MEDVSFPLDQAKGALRVFQESMQESSGPRRLEDQDEELNSNQVRQQPRPTDARVQEREMEKRAEAGKGRARNEPALEVPSQSIDLIDAEEEPLRENANNVNPLRGPRPSELRDDDATAVETERGQNISNLI